MATGVFGLKTVYKKQYQNAKNNNLVSWPESATYGYFGGGSPPITNLISRLDFSNETASDPGKNLPVTLGYAGGTASNLYGYFGGGETPNAISTITRFDFSNETLSNPGNNLSSARVMPAVIKNNFYGYFAGGKLTPPTTSGDQTSQIMRLDFSNETVSDPGKNLPAVRWRASAVSSNSYGYFGLGSASPPISYLSTIVRLDFSNETSSLLGRNLPTVSTADAGHAIFSIDYGYFSGGDSGGGGTSAIARLEFSNELVTDPGRRLPTVLMGGSPVQSSSFGYIGGGYKSGFHSSFIRTDFSTETISVPSSKLSSAKERTTSFSGGASVYRGTKTFGYFAGGIGGVSTITRLNFSSETVSNPGNNLPSGLSSLASTSNNFYGYFGGGYNSASPPYVFSTITRLDFSNETISSPGKNLPTGRSQMGGTSSNSYGYYVGGYISDRISTITRLDFSNETVSDPGKNLPSARNHVAATSTSSYGYFGGGQLPSIRVNTITRLDFSNETVSDPGKNLPVEIRNMGGISNNSYGYFGGGYGGFNVYFSTISRLEFSTETVSNPGKNLPVATTSIAGTSGSFYGYFGGGYIGPAFSSTNINTITRLDFSTENLSNPGNNLPTARTFFTGLSNSN
jgi:hypothetical protein